MTLPLIVFGSGGHAKVLVEAVLAATPERRIHVLDDDKAAQSGQLLGLAVAGGREWLADNLPQAPVALGLGNNGARWALIEWLGRQGRKLESVVHPTAIVSSSAQIGPGTFLAAGSIVIAEARIGTGSIINTAASVDHDCQVGDCVHIAPGVRLCGTVSVGNRTLIGVGSVVTPGVRIGEDVTIGGGSVVVSDLADGGRFAGCPARPIR